MNGIKEIASRLRNIFCISEFKKRDRERGVVQVKTHNGKVLEKNEAFPYGFYAKAKNGRAIVFCQGGNYDSFEIMPVLKADDVKLPELEEGDAALYTGGGSVVIARESGRIEIKAKGNCKIYLGNEQVDNCALITGLIDKIKELVTAGSPASQTINTASQQILEAYKLEVKKLFAGAE